MARRPLLLLACVLAGGPALAQSDDGMEARLREALRSATIQQRALEDDNARLRAETTQARKDLDVLRQDLAAAKAEAGKKVAPEVIDRLEDEFNAKLSHQNDALARLGESLDKWQAAYQEAANLARAKEAARARLETANGQLTDRAQTCEMKNAALYRVGQEILDRYAAVDMGDILARKEPFLGFATVQMQNLVQDYQDKLLDQRIQK
jgi:chromosome segregation ATPase